MSSKKAIIASCIVVAILVLLIILQRMGILAQWYRAFLDLIEPIRQALQ